ncbi:MAG: SMC-Scp complex subunit ScpB [Oscillospiraceae bacterium]|jgi:segregation and condensation protein B|nr:SMC-Scp complex subunit ScpB [Oscillospiraceae bacterium]
MELRDIQGALEGILFASGEPVPAERLAAVLGINRQLVFDAAAVMCDRYESEGRGIRLVRVEDSLQLCSAPKYADYIRLALETGRAPRLSQPALEVLAVIAYFQPVTRAYVEQVRGVDCSYTISLLQQRGLIEARGRLSVPGRPALYGTTAVFLRTFGIASTDELPELPMTVPREEGQPEALPGGEGEA